jgi:hypothetical protein
MRSPERSGCGRVLIRYLPPQERDARDPATVTLVEPLQFAAAVLAAADRDRSRHRAAPQIHPSIDRRIS